MSERPGWLIASSYLFVGFVAFPAVVFALTVGKALVESARARRDALVLIFGRWRGVRPAMSRLSPPSAASGARNAAPSDAPGGGATEGK